MVAERSHASQPPRNTATGSQTATVARPSNALHTPDESQQNGEPPAAILRLRGAQRNERNVQWAENVVDNEGLNRKKSKVCCIYHRPRAVDESSDDSSSSDSDSSSSSDGDSDGGLAARNDADRAFRNRPGGTGGNGLRASSRRHAPDCPEHGHDHDHVHGHNHGHDSSEDDDADDEGRGRDGSGNGKGKGKAKEKRKPSPNAYEKMPRYNKPDKPQAS